MPTIGPHALHLCGAAIAGDKSLYDKASPFLDVMGKVGLLYYFQHSGFMNFINVHYCHCDNEISLVEVTIVILLSRTFLHWGFPSCVIENYL